MVDANEKLHTFAYGRGIRTALCESAYECTYGRGIRTALRNIAYEWQPQLGLFRMHWAGLGCPWAGLGYPGLV